MQSILDSIWTRRKTSKLENSLTKATMVNASFDFCCCCCCRSRIKRTIVPNEYNANNCIKSMYSLCDRSPLRPFHSFVSLGPLVLVLFIYFVLDIWFLFRHLYYFTGQIDSLSNYKKRKKEWNPVGAHTHTHSHLRFVTSFLRSKKYEPLQNCFIFFVAYFGLNFLRWLWFYLAVYAMV